MPTREELAEAYFAQLPYPPYPVQEEAMLAWFTAEQGVLVCAPTGTGKTLIAQAALYEALHTGTVVYYTTPLIALTEQKFAEMQATVERWGFPASEVGLVTGHRRVNPDAKILVVVAEILLNRLLNPAEFDFTNVSAVVMDEFHSFADQQRGIVWELSLAMLPAHVRLLLLSATVGNAGEFLLWLERAHQRKVELVEGRERKVPLTYRWVPDQFLGEQLVLMAQGDDAQRTTPALVFCFNRDQCWSVAEQLKGLDLLPAGAKGPLNAAVDPLDWSQGVGPKLKQMLRRGVGVHHAGLLPKYRRVVEDLFEKKMLAVAVCTETLAAGINLPARSVVLTSLVKGPPSKEKLIDASTAHQIFGRAGRPQFDSQGFVYALAHEDDVKIHRWKEKYDQIPDTTKDPKMLKMKKDLERKKPTRRSNAVYWNDIQFEKLQIAPPGRLYSKGSLPWRLLAYLLQVSPDVNRVRTVIRKRLMDQPRLVAAEKQLEGMLQTLAVGGYVTLEPTWPPPDVIDTTTGERVPDTRPYRAERAVPTPMLERLLAFRSVHPLYAAWLLDHLAIADRDERLQLMESALEMPRSVLRSVRVPDELPTGPLAAALEPELVSRGLIVVKPPPQPGEEDDDDGWEEEEERPPSLAEKLRLLFDAIHPDVTDVSTTPVWSAGALLQYGGNFNKYVLGHDLTKQEGIVFRHFLRLILLCGEFSQVTPANLDPEVWRADLREIAMQLTESCRAVDPQSTDQAIAHATDADPVAGEKASTTKLAVEALLPEVVKETPPEQAFGAGVFED